jgi:hypothetical protein
MRGDPHPRFTHRYATNQNRFDLGFDPFEDRKFVAFLTGMAEKEWEPNTVIQVAGEIDELGREIERLEKEIHDYEGREAEMNREIIQKRKRIGLLESDLKKLADNLGQTPGAASLPRPEFTEGAPHIRMTQSEIKTLKRDENLLVVFFTSFKLSHEVARAGKVFLLLQFLDQEPKRTEQVDPDAQRFNCGLSIVCRNDVVLGAYLQKSAIDVRLCRERDGVVTEIGMSELNLMAFTENVTGFRCRVELWTGDGRTIGDLEFEAALLYPLKRENE